jgi:hypothetical protein
MNVLGLISQLIIIETLRLTFTFRGCFEDFSDFRGILVILEILEPEGLLNFFILFFDR